MTNNRVLESTYMKYPTVKVSSPKLTWSDRFDVSYLLILSRNEDKNLKDWMLARREAKAKLKWS